MLLSVGLLLRAVRVANHPIQERIPAPFTRETGGYAISYFAHHGNQRKRLARLNGISPPYTIEVGQKLNWVGRKVAVVHVNQPPNPRPNRIGYTVISGTEIFLAASRARCWLWPTTGKVIMPYSTADGAIKGLISQLHEVHLFTPRVRKGGVCGQPAAWLR